MACDLALQSGLSPVETLGRGSGFLQRQRPSSPVADGAVENVAKLGDPRAQLWIGVDLALCPADRIEDGGVVTAAEDAADLGQREVGHLAREQDRDLPRPQRGRSATRGDELRSGEAEGGGC